MNSGFLKDLRGYNFANAVLKQIFTKHLNIVKIVKERIKMIYCQSRTSSELLFTNHLHHQKHQKDSYLHPLHFLVSFTLEKKVKT